MSSFFHLQIWTFCHGRFLLKNYSLMKVFRFFVKIEQHLKMLFLVPFLCCDADGGMWPFWNYEQSGVSQSGVGTLRLFF